MSITTEEFIERASKVHNGKYDYSKTVYVNNYTKVCIICPEHGEFWQRPNDHLRGRGCKVCSGYTRSLSPFSYDIYKRWIKMKVRCTQKSFQGQRPTYIGCCICDEWQKFEYFLEWASERYIVGWQLDKDIIIKGNKVYSPETCCFVPQRINTLFTKRQRQRGGLPIGVCNNGKKFRGELQKDGKKVKFESRETIHEAFCDYKSAKESYIKEIADEYKEQLEPRVYEALYNYQVEITD